MSNVAPAIWCVESRIEPLDTWMVISFWATEAAARGNMQDMNAKHPDRQRRVCKYVRAEEPT